MRSKNLVPVQVILPQDQKPMGSKTTARKSVFEEALQSTIEASLRSSGTVPSHIFSSLYQRCRPQSNDSSRPGPSHTLLPPPDNSDGPLDIKPDVSGINRDLLGHRQGTPDEQKSSPGTSSTPSGNAPSVHSTLSPREQQSQISPFVTPVRGPPPLLLSMPKQMLRPSTTVPGSNQMSQTTNGNRFMMQRLPTMLPKNMQLEQLKQVQTEQLKHLQQIQRWNLLQQQRLAAGSLPLPRLPFFNPLMPPAALNRNVLVKPGSSVNGVHSHPSEPTQGDPASPSSPMFRKGFCKGGKDIRLSTLKRDGSYLAPYPSEYTLVAMSISPSSPQVPTSTGIYQPPDIPSEAMVVVAISVKCLPPQQHDLNKPLKAQCIGCGEGALHTFALLSSHINLRTTSPSQSAANLSGTNPLQRHARNFVLKDDKLPHGCLRGAVVPWRVNGNTTNRQPATIPQLMSLYMSGNHQAMARGTGPPQMNPNNREQGTFKPRANAQFPIQTHKTSWKYKQNDRTMTRPTLTSQIRPQFQPSVAPSSVTVSPDIMSNAQPTTSEPSSILIDSPKSVNSSPKQQQKLTGDWSPISAGPSSHSSTSDALNQSRLDPDWNSTVKFPENLPANVGRPLVLICWEWQQLHSNIQNVHITHTYSRCYEEAFSETLDSAVTPLTREMCYMVTVQYLASLEKNEFPTMSSLSAWLGRSRIMFSSMRQVQLSTAHAVTLARLIITNQPHKIGIVVSQISQAHAINECIAGLKPDGPDYHVIAHISGDTILDLCVLLTGHVSRLTREHLLTADEYTEFVEQIVTSNNFSKVQEKLSVPHMDGYLAKLASSQHQNNLKCPTSFVSMATPQKCALNPPTSSSLLASSQETKNPASELSTSEHLSVSTPHTHPACRPFTLDENNNIPIVFNSQEDAANQIAEQLFSHVSTLCEDHNKLDLSRFTSVRCSFLLPPTPVCQTEAIADVTESGIMQDLGICGCSKPSPTDFRKILFPVSIKTRQRFNALCEHIKVNTSTLFFLFHLDSHLYYDSSTGSEWLSSMRNEIMSMCSNVLLVSSTHIPQALLNQNTSISLNNILFCFPTMRESLNSSSNHCLPSSSQDLCRNMTFDPEYEAESISLLNSIPQYHSAAVNAKLLTRQYIGALATVVHLHQVLATGKSSIPNSGPFHQLTTPTTLAIVKDLLSSASGITVLLRVASESVASMVVSELTEARRKLQMQEAFEIMLYASHMKPRISEYFLQIIRKYKGKPVDWTPDTLSEINCIPLLLVHTGRDVPNHLMPCSLRYVDLRLVANNLETQCQSFFLSEVALASGCYRVLGSSLPSIESSTEPTKKKRKTECAKDASLSMDVFSEDSASGDENKLKWRTFDEKQAIDSLRKLSNGNSNDVQEISSEDEFAESKQTESNRKRGHESSDDEKSQSRPSPTSSSLLPRLVLSKDMFSFMESYANSSSKFLDLLPHSNTEWVSHTRSIISGNLTDQQMTEYLRKWTRPLPGHPDNQAEDGGGPQGERPRHILLVTPPHNRVSLACCIFTKKMNSMLLKMMQVEVYDFKSSSVVKPSYPLPNSDILPKWPEHSVIMDMDFCASVDTSCADGSRSQISNGVQDGMLDPTNELYSKELTTSSCMTGRECAFDVNHRQCDSCQTFPDAQEDAIFLMSVPNCGVNRHTVSDESMALDVTFSIPNFLQHHFVFQNHSENETVIKALNLSSMNAEGVKTPVFSLGVSGPRHGLYNLDHTLFGRNEAPRSPSDNMELAPLRIDEGIPKSEAPLHIIVVRNSDYDEFKSCWPNRILMVLPEAFNDLGIGAMKYAVQCVMQRSVSVKQEQHDAFSESCNTGDVWPFAMLLDDRAVVWTSCTSDYMDSSVNRFSEDLTEINKTKEWRNISLSEVLRRIESIPSAHRYAAIGVRPWSSRMEAPKCIEDFSGVEMNSQFSKCHLTSCLAINTHQTKEVMYDFARFTNEDIDWCMRAASADLPLFRFNDIAMATKVMSSPSRKQLTSVDSEQFSTLVSLADSEFTPIPRHPNLLLELYLGKSGAEVFPKSRGNSTHPVLVVDHYFSLGSEVHVEFTSSRSGALDWATDYEKRYCGLLLYCPSTELSQGFLQQFQFTPGATVCVVGRDRSSLRHAVVNLHLENDWHFRLTDEFQTTNDTMLRKPLYYLTGVSRASAR